MRLIENTEKGSNEDKHVVERTNEPIIANDAENPDENNTGLAADFSEDTGMFYLCYTDNVQFSTSC